MAFSGSLQADDSYETPPTLEASHVLPAEMQRGAHFIVRKEVQNDGYMNDHRVDSDFGQFEAYGGVALAKLIQEIDALAQYDVGKIDLLSVLQMQSRWIGARVGLIRIQNERLAQRINLHLALGGSLEEGQ